MNDDVYFVFRSVTLGQRGAEVLAEQGVKASLRRCPRALSPSGCAYAVVLRKNERERAAEILEQEGVLYQGVYLRTVSGGFKDVKP